MEMAQKDPWFWRDGRAHVRAQDMDWAPFSYCDSHELEKIKVKARGIFFNYNLIALQILEVMAIRHTLGCYQYYGWKTVFGEFIYHKDYYKVLTFLGIVKKINSRKEIL